ncbi:MAG TPA: hypothetical protein VGN96_00285, partial [Roseococcus sp.]|nr:hypothetical protein [Roseococcus sp.]
VGTAAANIFRHLGTLPVALAEGSYVFSRFAAFLSGWGVPAPRLTAFGVTVTPTEITPSAALVRYSLPVVIPSGGGSPAFAIGTNPAIAAGAALNLDAFFGWDVLEAGTFASTPILPPIGTPGASTRGQDNVTAAFASLFPAGVGTVLGSCMIPQSAPAGGSQAIVDINDGTQANRFSFRNNAGGNDIVASLNIGGTPLVLPTLGTMTPGTLLRFGLTWDGTTVVANLDGGANQSAASATPPGLTTLRAGNNANGTAPMFGEIAYLDALPYVVPAANLPAAVAAMPG